MRSNFDKPDVSSYTGSSLYIKIERNFGENYAE